MRGARAAVVLVASLAVAGVVALAVPRAAVAQEQYAEFAQRRFLRGRELFETNDFAGALAEFRASLALYNSPNTRLYVARCLRELGRLPEAAGEFERALLEATDRAARDERYEPTRDAAREELAALEPRLARVTVRAPAAAPVPAGLALTIAGRELPEAALGVPVTVMPGRVEIVATAPGHAAAHATVDAVAGQRVTVELPPLRPRAPRPFIARPPPFFAVPVGPGAPGAGTGEATRLAGLVLGGVGLGAMTSFAVLGGLDLSTNAMCDAAMMCPDASVIERGRAFQTGANVSLAAGATLVVSSAVLLIVAATVFRSPVVRTSRGERNAPLGARP